VAQAEVRQQVVLDDGRVLDIELPPTAPLKPATRRAPASAPPSPAFSGETRRVPLGDLVYARSGDKGADASLGVWLRNPEAWGWARETLSAERLRRLLSLRQDVGVEVHELPNVAGLLFILKGYFGESGSGNIALDPIGKAIGEFLRARLVDAPVELLASEAVH
jgi:hypothetical protein